MNDQKLQSQRLAYEVLRVEHAADLFPALSHPLVSEHLDCDPPASIEELAAEFERMSSLPAALAGHESWLNFVVRLKEDGRWIGRIQATVRADWAEVGYLFEPSCWGQGYATESLAWLQTFVATQYGVSEFWACVAPENIRSTRLLHCAGYEPALPCDQRPLGSYETGDEIFRHFLSESPRE